MSVARAQREIDAREFAEWMAYDNIEPFGEQRADWRIAQLCCLVANSLGGKGPPATLKEFMMDTSRKVRQSAGQMLAVMRSYVAGHNARFRGKR